MSKFCNKYPQCGCVDIGTKCYDDQPSNPLRTLTVTRKELLEAALDLDEHERKKMAPKPPSRNAPCPCGSRKNYKRCHGK
jgi:hypothetical protein